MGGWRRRSAFRHVCEKRQQRPACNVSGSPEGARSSGPWRKPWETRIQNERKPRQGRRRCGINVAHTYTNILIHALFSTKNRHPWLSVEVRCELFPYLGGTVNKLGGQSVLVNGAEDHVHMLLVQPASLSLADLMEKVKANSSSWVKRRWPERRSFAWQAGYTAFSVSKSHVAQVERYIAGQEEHHRKMSFQDEVLAFLKKHGIAYDPRYVFG